MRTFTIAAIVAALTMPAYAQGTTMGGSKGGSVKPQKTEQEKFAEEKQQKLDEKAYKDSLSRVPDRDQKPDPWKGIR